MQATYDTGKPESWKTLTSYLSDIANAGKFQAAKVAVLAMFCITKILSLGIMP